MHAGRRGIVVKAQCQRCGTCCKKGGPGLHKEDLVLVESGRIPGRALFTIRTGELVRDNVKGILSPLEEEMIKIKGTSGRWTCIFYDESSKGCGIYEDRPLECRALNCRDTSEIEKVYSRSRLTRKDLLSKVAGLWDLIEEHEERCSYAKIKLLVDEGGANGLLKRKAIFLRSCDTMPIFAN
jgi:Fe-S-cluster containining protein